MSALLCVRFKHLKCQINATGMFSQMLPLRGRWISALWLVYAICMKTFTKFLWRWWEKTSKPRKHLPSKIQELFFVAKSTFLFIVIPYVCNVLQFILRGRQKLFFSDGFLVCLAVEFGQMAFCNVTNKADIYSWNVQSLKCLQIRSVSGSDRALNHIMLSLLQIFAF